MSTRQRKVVWQPSDGRAHKTFDNGKHNSLSVGVGVKRLVNNAEIHRYGSEMADWSHLLQPAAQEGVAWVDNGVENSLQPS